LKTIGRKQLLQKKHKYVPLTGKLLDTFGKMPVASLICVFGLNGVGKTELVHQVVCALLDIFKNMRARWVSYEQGHGADIQEAVKRNFNDTHDGQIAFSDPYEDFVPGMSLLQELDAEMSKPKSAWIWVIDSIDAAHFDEEEFWNMYKKHSKKKLIICLSFEVNGQPKTVLARNIGGYGHYKIHVKKFIGYVEKSRFGGDADYIIYEERARELNKAYFELLEGIAPVPVKKVRKARKTSKK